MKFAKALRDCVLQGMSSQSLQTPKKQWNMKLLSTVSWQAQKCTPPVHKSPGIIPLVCALDLSGLVFYTPPQPPSLLPSLLLQCMYLVSLAWRHWIGLSTLWCLEHKWNRLLTSLIPSLSCESCPTQEPGNEASYRPETYMYSFWHLSLLFCIL